MNNLKKCGLLALALAACSNKNRTEIVVVFETDLAVPGEIDQLEVLAYAAGASDAGGFQRVYDLGSGSGKLALPASLGLVPSSDDDMDLRVVARGRKQGQKVSERTATTSFVPGETLVLRMRLLGVCSGVSCPSGQTCDDKGVCGSDSNPGEKLPRYRPETLFDASVITGDAGTGADASDAGAGGAGGAAGSGGHDGGAGGAGGVVGSGGVAGSGGGGSGGSGTGGGGSGGSGSGGSGSGGKGSGGSGSGGSGSGGSGSGGSGSGGSGSGGSGSGGSGSGGSGSGGSGSGGSTVPVSGMPIPPGDANVPKPSGTPGNLTILPWAGFTSAMTYTFDDGNSSQIQHYDELNALGVRMTFYLWTGRTEASNPIWGQALADGHELGNHTQTHPATASASDIDAATAFLQTKWGVKAYTMAAPNGSSTYVPFAQSRFLINRGVSNGTVLPNGTTDPFNLPTFIPPANATASQFTAQVDSARAAGGWKTVLVHGFTGGSDSAYQPVPLAEFVTGVKYAKELHDVWIDSMVNVGAYWRGQKTLAGVAPTTSGATTTWTWTLPANFPTGKYLRVRVDGGTLSQNGKPLVWYPNGFYEVALDAGSLTLAP